ncbi:MAG: phosphoglucomutase/phosphomannomutase family protein [Acidobacteria bacterium]|nr:phosphoglucomutase/phosphomannomutase family protein [Acidobacteriota bacterium]
MSTPHAIQFGTDGWRGVIAHDFTFENVRLVARAVARYIIAKDDASRGIIVGYDCRFLSDRFALAAAEQIAAAGIPVTLAAAYTPTPALSFAVRQQKTAGAVMITASHNPWQWNGLKVKASYGGSAAAEIVKSIEAEIPNALSVTAEHATAAVSKQDLIEPYLSHLAEIANLKNIARSRLLFIIDPMYGAARNCLAPFFKKHKIRCHEIHGEANPLFGGFNPEPIEPHISELRQAVEDLKADAGFATDGDADRVGAVDRSGSFIDSHQIFSILLRYLVDVRGMRGGIAKTFSTTKLVDKLAAHYSLPLYETPIGFKYICDHMLSKDILIGGEEIGGIGIPALGGPERDGVLNSVLLAEAMAHCGKSLAEIIAQIEEEFGPHRYGRIDLELRPGQKERAMGAVASHSLDKFAARPIVRRENLDGVKMYFQDGAWLLLRPSGTEPLLRIYAEAEKSTTVQELLSQTENFVRAL